MFTTPHQPSGSTFSPITQNPARVVKGLIILSPTEVFDISPGGFFSVDDLAV